MTQNLCASNAEALASPQDLVRQLCVCAEVLPEALRRQLMAAGAAMVPALITLQRTPELGANYLVDYGDGRALDVLAQTLDALPIREGDNLLANHVFIELRCAIETLGGHLTAAQQHKCAQADAPRRRFVGN